MYDHFPVLASHRMLAVNFTCSAPKYHTFLLFFPSPHEYLMEITISPREISNFQSKKNSICKFLVGEIQVFHQKHPGISAQLHPRDPSVTSVASLHSQSPALKAAEGNLARWVWPSSRWSRAAADPFCDLARARWDAGDVLEMTWSLFER